MPQVPNPNAPPVRIDDSFEWKLGRQDFRTPGAWAKVRVMADPRTGEEYCDVLIGVVSDEPHMHAGINRDLSLRFMVGRGRLHSIRREVEDSNWGRTEDKSVLFKPEPGRYQFQLKLRVSEPERTVWVDFEETAISETAR